MNGEPRPRTMEEAIARAVESTDIALFETEITSEYVASPSRCVHCGQYSCRCASDWYLDTEGRWTDDYRMRGGL